MESNKKIEITKDYGMFKKLKANRIVNLEHVKKIVASIKKVGYITSPIIVNEKFEVIEGQHRLAALKQLHMVVEYIVHPGAGIKECIAMNIIQEHWKINDYIHSYAVMGDSNYITLENLTKEFPYVPIEIIAGVCSGKLQTNGRSIRQGRFKLQHTKEYAREVVSYLNDFKNYSKASRAKKVMLKILAFCFLSPEIDEKYVIKKIADYPQMITPFNDTGECLETLEHLINYKKRGDKIYLRNLYDKHCSKKQYNDRHQCHRYEDKE